LKHANRKTTVWTYESLANFIYIYHAEVENDQEELGGE
jgi:hypothetical protein